MPEDGGDTMFADTTLAYDSLSEDRKRALENLVIVHDFEETRRRHKLPPSLRPPLQKKTARCFGNSAKA